MCFTKKCAILIKFDEGFVEYPIFSANRSLLENDIPQFFYTQLRTRFLLSIRGYPIIQMR